jgi:hypothetical protein
MLSGLWKAQINAAAWRNLAIITTLLAITGCGGSSVVQTRAPDYVDHTARTLAIAPADDLFAKGNIQLANTIGEELARRGYSIVDSTATMRILANNRIASVDVLSPQALTVLANQGIDAILSVSTSEAGGIGGPDMRHVKAKLTSTHTASQIGEINWNNSWGGMPGSPADYVMRKGSAEAARAVAEAVAKLLG